MTTPEKGAYRPLRIALSIGGPAWWRPRFIKSGGALMVGWLLFSVYVERAARTDSGTS